MDIEIDLYPQLCLLNWNRPGSRLIDECEALALYERNWAMVDQAALTDVERALIDRLIKEFGNGVFNV